MKKNLFLVFILFLVIMPVKAALPTSIGPISQVGNWVGDDCGGGEDECYGMALKKSGDSLPVICTKYDKSTPAGVNSCTITGDWNRAVRYGVAAIINEAKPRINVTGITAHYFAAELAINNFLAMQGDGGYHINANILTSTYKSLYNTYLGKAEEAYGLYRNFSEVQLPHNTFVFSLENGYYVSQKVEFESVFVERMGGYDSYTVKMNNDKIKLEKYDDGFVLKIKESDVTGITEIEGTFEAVKSIPQARNYDCGNNYQSITPLSLETFDIEYRQNIGGVIEPRGILIIKKVDSDNKYLSGAKIKITGPNSYSKTITSGTKAITLNDLDYGTYTIEEISAPAGYYKAPKQTVEIEKSATTHTITMVNKKNKLQISKTDITGTKEIPGATLQIEDTSGNIVKYCPDETNSQCRWISTTTPYLIEGIPAGTYYLKEISSPNGYALNEEKIKFTVINSDTVQKVSMPNTLNKISVIKKDEFGKVMKGVILQLEDEKGNIIKYCPKELNSQCRWFSDDEPYVIEGLPKGTYYIKEVSALEGYIPLEERIEVYITSETSKEEYVLINKRNSITIRKTSAMTKEPLAGAVLQLQDKDGNIVKNCTDSNGNKNIECKWTTTEDPYTILGLPKGEYYLKEVSAPKGYAVLKDPIKINVDDSFKSIVLVLENELEVDVPDTLSSRSALLIVISMFDIALGIGIINYVKKNKVTE